MNVKTIDFDIEKIREDFPILRQTVNGNPLVYLDNGASSQKPASVIRAIETYYSSQNANIHRGVHHLSQIATQAYEDARVAIQTFINARHEHEVLFTKGTTDSINLVAQSFGRKFLREGDEIVITTMEHHSNIVPWQMVCESTGAKLRVAPINQAGDLILDEFVHLLNEKTRLVAVAHVSNALGTINPVEDIIKHAHAVGAKVLLDGAQAVPHMKVDVQSLDVDFYTFSGHKVFGPTGVGILYGREDLLNAMPPYQGGGDMIERVTFEKTTYNTLPHKFEAGTPNIVGGIGLHAAIRYFESLDLKSIAVHENDLLNYATDQLTAIDGLKIVGTAKNKASVISFLIGDTHPFDVGTLLDQQGIAVRTGHHCTQPLMDFYGIPGTVRASFALYNNREDVDKLAAAAQRAANMLQ
ncbi:MAG: cysteine desulfurase [Pseudomonadota bacterium]